MVMSQDKSKLAFGWEKEILGLFVYKISRIKAFDLLSKKEGFFKVCKSSLKLIVRIKFVVFVFSNPL